MKLMKPKGYNGTVRSILNDEKSEVLGVVGTFADLLKAQIVEKVTGYSFDTWCCIPAPCRIESWNGIGATREEAISNCIFGKKL